MGKSRKSSEGLARQKVAGFVALGLLAIGALGVSAAALMRPAPEASSSASFTPEAVVPPTRTAPSRVTIAQAMERLKDPTRPFTMVVLGDSTGSDAVSWPGMVGEWLGGEYDRPVTMYPWSEGTKPPGYQPPRELSTGTKAPVTIYNGSAPSRNTAYSMSELDKFIPGDKSAVDLVIVSHGHNQGPATLRTQFGALASALLAQATNSSIVAIVQNPEKSGSPHDAIHEDNLANLRLYTEGSNFETIDIHKAFVDYGDFASLYKDNVHPAGAEGYRIWADVVIAAMKG